MYRKARRQIALLLTVLTFLSAVSFQPALTSALAANNTQKTWQSILDADLTQENIYNDKYSIEERQTIYQTDALETSEAIKTRYETELQKETEEYKTDRYIIKYSSGVPELFQKAASQKETAVASIETADCESNIAVVTLKETQNISEFRESIKAASLDRNIEYIQPDYAMVKSVLLLNVGRVFLRLLYVVCIRRPPKRRQQKAAFPLTEKVADIYC